MANDEIKTRIGVDYEGGDDMRRAAEDARNLGQAANQGGDQAESAARGARDQAKATEDLGQQNREAAQSQQQLSQETREGEQAQDQAVRSERKRRQSIGDMREELIAEIEAEQRYQQEVKEGTQQDQRATAASQARQRRINELTKGLATRARAEQEAARRIRETANANERAGSAAGQADRATGSLTGTIGMAAGALSGMAGGVLGAGGLITAFEALNDRLEKNNQYLRENAQLSRDAAESQLDLVALSGVSDPEEVAFVERVGQFSGEGAGRTARTLATAKSQFPNASQEQIRELTTLAARQSRISESSSTELLGGLSAIFRSTGDADAASNILNQAITEAGEVDPGRLAREIGKFIGVGEEIGGMTPGESAGFAASATGLGLPNEISITGMRAFMTSLAGGRSPDGQKVLGRIGAERDDPMRAIEQIVQARESGQINERELIDIVGEEGLPVLAKLSNRDTFEDFRSRVERVAAAETSDRLLLADKEPGIFGDQRQNLNLLAKQQEQKAINTRASDTRALEAEAARKVIEARLAEATKEGLISPYQADVQLQWYDKGIASGMSAERAAAFAENRSVSPSLFQGGKDLLFNTVTDPFGVASRGNVELDEAVSQELEQGAQLDPDEQRSEVPIEKPFGFSWERRLNQRVRQMYQGDDEAPSTPDQRSIDQAVDQADSMPAPQGMRQPSPVVPVPGSARGDESELETAVTQGQPAPGVQVTRQGDQHNQTIIYNDNRTNVAQQFNQGKNPLTAPHSRRHGYRNKWGGRD